MSLSTVINRIEYAGNDSTTLFSFPYYFLADGDLVVSITDALGVNVVKTITTEYTVANAGVPAGGSVTMITAPATGETLIIYRDPAVTQVLDLVENDSAPAEPTEEALDRSTMIAQRNRELIDRSIILSDGFTGTFSTELPSSLPANEAIVVNAAGNGLETNPISGISGTATLASQSEAEAGTDNTKFMSPLRVQQLIDVQLPEKNLGMSATVASSALTINLVQADGTNGSATEPIVVTFRGSAVNSDFPRRVNYEAALSIVVPQGATLGSWTVQSDPMDVYLYAIYDGTNKEIAVSLSNSFDESKVDHATTILNSSSDSSDVLYSTTARTGLSIKLIGRLFWADIGTGTFGDWIAPSRVVTLSGGESRTGYLGELATTSNWGANTAAQGFYWYTNGLLIAKIKVTLTGGATGTLSVAYPSGFSLNIQQLPGTSRWPIGTGMYRDSSTGFEYNGTIYGMATPTAYFTRSQGSGVAARNILVTQAAPTTWTTGDELFMHYEVPGSFS